MFIQSPYEMAHHPIFWFDSRRIRHARPLWSCTWDMLVRVHVLFVIACIVIAAIGVANGGEGWEIEWTLRDFIALVIGAVILAGVLLDFSSILAGLPTVSGEIVNGRWDLLRLTALNDWGIVQAKHAGVRLRVWRATSIIVSIRIATVSLGLVVVYILPFLTQGYSATLNAQLNGFLIDPISTALLSLVAVITVVVYVIEPIWRMQAMTAAGMALSSRIMNTPLAMLAGFGVIVATWILQAIIIAALVFGLGSLSAGLIYHDPDYIPVYEWLDYLYVLFCCIITAVTVYGFYALMQSISLRRVAGRIRRMN